LDAVMHLAMALTARGDLARAARFASALQEQALAVPNPHTPLWAHAAGRIWWLQGRYGELQGLVDRLAPDALGIGQVCKLSLRGLLALGQGRPGEAERLLREAVAGAANRPAARAAGEVRLWLARALAQAGRQGEARALVREVEAECEAAGTPGRLALESLVMGGVPSAPAAAAAPLPEPLTQREEEVLRLLIAGASNKEIGAALYIGEETVKTHVARILRKLDVTTRARAAARGRELGYGG
jgi:ATP/maltotriose-dependent transcriptional regulator MalT